MAGTVLLELAPGTSVEVDYAEAFAADEKWFARLYRRHVYGAKRREAKVWAKEQIAERVLKVVEHKALIDNKRLRRFLKRISDPTELTGDGQMDRVMTDPSGPSERELRARMRMAQRGLDGDEFP